MSSNGLAGGPRNVRCRHSLSGRSAELAIFTTRAVVAAEHFVSGVHLRLAGDAPGGAGHSLATRRRNFGATLNTLRSTCGTLKIMPCSFDGVLHRRINLILYGPVSGPSTGHDESRALRYLASSYRCYACQLLTCNGAFRGLRLTVVLIHQGDSGQQSIEPVERTSRCSHHSLDRRQWRRHPRGVDRLSARYQGISARECYFDAHRSRAQHSQVGSKSNP